MGTVGSAEALHLLAGRIAPGHNANHVALDRDDPSLQPPMSYKKNVVYSMNPHAIRAVVVAGSTVLRDDQPQLVLWEEVLTGLRTVTRDGPL
jgi:5-methylthioadenosine/S-adenosylhomocysteine deaminase